MAFYGYQDPTTEYQRPDIDPLTGQLRVPPRMPIPRPAPQQPVGMAGLPPAAQIAPQAPPPMPTPLDLMPPPPSMPDLSAVDAPPPDLRPTNVRDLTGPSLATPSIPDVPQTSQPYRDALAYELSNPPKPKLWQRLAAGAVGGLAGAVNASGRTRIDPRITESATRGILMGGYDDRVARAGSLAQLERQREQDAENARYKEAQITQMKESTNLRKAQEEANRLRNQGLLDDRERNDYIAMSRMGGEIIEPGTPLKPGYEIAPFKIQGKQVMVPTGATSRRLAKQAEIEATSVPSNPILAKWYKEQTGQDLKPTLTRQENEDLIRMYEGQARRDLTKTEGEANRTLRESLAQFARDRQSTAADARDDARKATNTARIFAAVGKDLQASFAKEHSAADSHYNAIQSLSKGLKSNPAATKHAIIVTYLKLIDNNAVKEGEVKALQAAQSLRSKAEAALQSPSQGGFVADSFINEILGSASDLYNSYKDKYNTRVRDVAQWVRDMGGTDEDILGIVRIPKSKLDAILAAEPSPSGKPAQKTPPQGVVPFTPIR